MSAWQAFLWTTAPLVFKYIGLKALRHLDPCDPLPSLRPKQYSVFPTAFCSGCQR